MNIFQKFSVSFILALTLHLTILGLFGISFVSESDQERIKQKPLPEIIQASMLDDEKILEEANRLKINEENKQVAQQEKQKTIENKLKKEQQRLDKVKKERLKEEKKTKALEKNRKALAIAEKKKREQLNKLKAEEAARLSKIKKQKAIEKKRLDAVRKAENDKREKEKVEKQKKQQALLAQQKAAEVKKAALFAQQAAAAKAKIASNKQATITSTVAIQRKVNNSWIKPISSAKGLSCTIRVKLLPSGDVMDASIIRGSGNSIFDRSAENAVLKASPLPVPRDRTLFTQKFRTFTFVFKPE